MNEGGIFGVFLALIFSIIPIVFMCIPLIIGIVSFGLWVWMLVDILQRSDAEFGNSNDKLMWVLLILLVPGIGSLLYFFIVYQKFARK